MFGWWRTDSQAKGRTGPTILFAFDHGHDTARARVVVEHWRTIGALEDAGLVSEEEWRKIANRSESSVRKFFDGEMERSLATVVLIGAETHADQWVRDQIQKTHARGDAIIGIYVHNVPSSEGTGTQKGNLYFGPLGTDGKGRETYFSHFATIYDWQDDCGVTELAKWIECARTRFMNVNDLEHSWKGLLSGQGLAKASGRDTSRGRLN
jgi:hypothetical protein